MIEWMADKIIGTMAVLGFLLVFIGLPFLGYSMYIKYTSPTFTLDKSDWACSISHEESVTIMIMVGKVLVPQTSHSMVCDQWSKK